MRPRRDAAARDPDALALDDATDADDDEEEEQPTSRRLVLAKLAYDDACEELKLFARGETVSWSELQRRGGFSY